MRTQSTKFTEVVRFGENGFPYRQEGIQRHRNDEGLHVKRLVAVADEGDQMAVNRAGIVVPVVHEGRTGEKVGLEDGILWQNSLFGSQNYML